MIYPFTKVLAKYYEEWYRDCHDSAIYCQERGRTKDAERYLDRAAMYFNLINENWEELNECLATR